MDVADHPARAQSRGAALAALVAGALAIGAAPILVRLAHAGPAVVGFWRLALALPLLWILAWRARIGPVRQASPVMLAAGLFFALDLVCWHYGIRLTSIVNSAVLPNLTPVLVALAGWLLLNERPTSRFVVGLAAAVAGAAVMSLGGHSGSRQGAGQLGDALCLATAVWYGLYFLCVRQARASRTTLEVMIWTSLVGAPILLAAAVILREPLLPTVEVGRLALLGLGVVHVAGQGAIAWALGRLPASTAALIVLIQPVAAAALAWLTFGEIPTAWQSAGAVLALAGVVAAQTGGRRPTAE
jgi:drug/metabolite transporter (DMT)-like permease